MSGVVRLSLNLPPGDADKIKGYARRKRVSVTEATRRAIAVLGYVDAVQSRGAAIVVDEDGKLKEVVFLA